jgi:hypothetical protein
MKRASINSIQSITPSDGINNFAAHQVGNTRSGEIFNLSTTVFHPPGLVSHPLPAGSFVDGVFTPSQFSQFSAQEVNLENETNWISLGMRDGRVEALLPATQVGETLLYPEGNPASYTYLNIAGDHWIVSPTQIVQQCGQANSLLKADGSISLLTSSTGAAGGSTVGMIINPSSGISLANQYGSIVIDQSGITLTVGQCAITLSVTGELDINGLIVNIQGELANIAGTAATTVGVGAVPSPASAAILGTAVGTGGTVVGVATPSTNVFLGP